MKIDVWHTILWSRYKGEVFSELYRIGKAGGVEITFYQIAETGTERQSLARFDLSCYKYPFELKFPGAFENISQLRLIIALGSAALHTEADLWPVAGYDSLEYWVQWLILLFRRSA